MQEAISAAQVTLGDKTIDTNKEQLSDSNGNVVSTDTTNTSRALVKADVAGLQQQAQQQQADNMLLFKAAVAFTDPAFKAAFLGMVFITPEAAATEARYST